MILQLFNSDGQQLQDFIPFEQGKARIYCCGPTVYAVAHLGNLRAYVTQDLLRRTLEMLAYQVQHVMNITDVGHLSDDGDAGEDKMLRSARQAGLTVWQIAAHFSDIFFHDCAQLNITPPTVCCRATEHITEMVALIQQLEQKGYTYQAAGNIYFNVAKLGKDYGRLVNLQQQQLQHGKRIAIDNHKRNPEDFVLWFTQSKFEHQAMQWDSPWGRGYPGWHIECSAMALHYLGDHLDIHCGGVDHLAVHHTNEIAQSESVIGHRWANYWIHNEFLLMDADKMSKSDGNIIDIAQLQQQGFEALDYRYFLFNGHYRSQLRFSFEAVQGAHIARKRLRQRLEQLQGQARRSGQNVSTQPGENYWQQFKAALCRDLNSPQALALLWQIVKDEQLSAWERLSLVSRCDQVLALDLLPIREEKEAEVLVAEAEQLWQQRLEARRQKNYQLSDSLRNRLLEFGITIEDKPEGSSWRRI